MSTNISPSNLPDQKKISSEQLLKQASDLLRWVKFKKKDDKLQKKIEKMEWIERRRKRRHSPELQMAHSRWHTPQLQNNYLTNEYDIKLEPILVIDEDFDAKENVLPDRKIWVKKIYSSYVNNIQELDCVKPLIRSLQNCEKYTRVTELAINCLQPKSPNIPVCSQPARSRPPASLSRVN